MTEIKAKRHILKFYLRVGFVFIFFFGLATSLIWLFVTDLSTKDTPTIKYLLPVFSCVLYYLSYETITRYVKSAPIISIDNNSIKFGETIKYSISDVIRVEFTGKQPFKHVFNTTLDGCAIEFRDGTIRYFYDDMYSNFWILKQFLQQTLKKSAEVNIITIRKVKSVELKDEEIVNYKNNQLKSINGIIFWLVLLIFILLLLFASQSNTAKGLLIVYFLFFIFWLPYNSWLMHYFGISKHFFVVRKHNSFFMSDIYSLTDIREIVFETRYKMPKCLKVITSDFKSKLYPADTLKDDTWLELKEILENKGVTVKNECIME